MELYEGLYIYSQKKHSYHWITHWPRGATVARTTPDRKVIRSNRVGVNSEWYPFAFSNREMDLLRN